MIKLKDLLKESTWANRKFGERLPTMADYKKLKEEKLNEDQYGAESGRFVPLKIDKHAPNTRENFKDSIRSLSNAAYGFSLSEDAEMDDPGAAKQAHQAYNKWAKGIGTKLQKLYKELSGGWKVYHNNLYKTWKV